ncbi:MAG TPA: carboxypeptidase regulatory-like domain-containing protein, partial [Xanthobacteraceae bacterium]
MIRLCARQFVGAMHYVALLLAARKAGEAVPRPYGAMSVPRLWTLFVVLPALLLIALAPPAPAGSENRVALGGARGVVKTSKGDLLEGIMVQLIAPGTGIRTTVFSDADGRYEFPRLDAGAYTLRIAQPREFRPYVKENVDIRGAGELDDIVLTRMISGELLPPTPEIAAQMTGSEWLASLSGTGGEKKLLTVNCNWCHSYQQIFRNRYDEQGWAHIIDRMTKGAGSPLINMRPRGRFNDEDTARLVKWLATVRGPGSSDPPFVTLPRPQGRQTRVVITEYELPRLEIATHDVHGDSQGNIWYSPHRSSFIGRLDPRTGEVKEYQIPRESPGVLPGTHWIYVDRNDIVWGTENWGHNIWRLDPRSGDFKRIPWKVTEPVNSPGVGNVAFDPEGFI